jgi:hypothetical protein
MGTVPLISNALISAGNPALRALVWAARATSRASSGWPM